ncbi:GlxA family transcriptional regulator [Neptunomonas antarctica]|uniref:Transcriptional regulator, AraC family with amidase-like domain n=1 Tax=Neptunomonas antarctica TaxID=619304 RepID=A0A1N7P9P6_9GAMM|nr:helix-turn-helix domain-containing protein [Neptunomonas antarctica]SIT07323.1 transcriptional regulator, AraC family with amidase-like domain [Neptunomonas antarctica]
MNQIRIGIVNYPEALQSAVQGLKEMFFAANRICVQQNVGTVFEVDIYDVEHIADDPLQVVILPPCLEGDYHFNPDLVLKQWLLQQHTQGAILCSVCAGAFILASCGLLNQRPATTHWGLAERFIHTYPDVQLNSNKILVNDGDLITTGGLMAWLDLGLELVAQFTQPRIMRLLGKYLIVDTGSREQRYYRSFIPALDHGDKAVLNVQHYLQVNFDKSISISDLAGMSYLGERTFLRRFVKATGIKPNQYLQQLRIQKACDWIESSHDSVELIAAKVGYEDVSAFRKIFIKTMGLTPREFRSRFG